MKSLTYDHVELRAISGNTVKLVQNVCLLLRLYYKACHVFHSSVLLGYVFRKLRRAMFYSREISYVKAQIHESETLVCDDA